MLARGVVRGHEASSEVRLERTPEGDILHLVDYRVAAGAPDVRVYLSPYEAGKVDLEGAVELGRITVFSGDARFLVPEGVPSEEMRAAVVQCTKYSVTFGVAVLEPA